MNAEPTLWDQPVDPTPPAPLMPRARRFDHDTSQAAADAIAPRVNTDRERVLLAHADHPTGLDDFRLAELVGRQQTSAGKRRGELVALGLIAKTGQRATAPSGAAVIVWQITNAGLELARSLRTRSAA